MDHSNAEQRQLPSTTPQVIQTTQHGVHQEILGRNITRMEMHRSITNEDGTREAVATSDISSDTDQPTENATADPPDFLQMNLQKVPPVHPQFSCR